MIVKNQELEVVIEGYGSEGQGVARVDNFVIFVPFALKDEKVLIHIIKVTKNYAVGKIIKIIKASKHRCEPKCFVYGKCGGCSLQHSSYENALSIKEEIVKSAITKLGGLQNVTINNIIGSKNQYNYRNKAAFPIVLKEGNIDVCMYRNLSHDPIIIDNCNISDEKINAIAESFKNFINKNYNLEQKEGLKHLVIRVVDDKVLITIVTNKKVYKEKELFKTISSDVGTTEEKLGLYWCKKLKENNVILDGKLVHLLGIKSIVTDILGVKVEISPLSFFQVNIEIMKLLYKKVLNNIEHNQIVVDAYSGAGLLSALISKKAKQVYGIEIVEDATKNANKLKEFNKIVNLVNINNDVAKYLPILTKELGSCFTLVLDPPRKGVDEKVIETILSVRPQRIIYVSCGPASLARDLKLLCSEQYKIIEITPFDMFPQTYHVETFVLLERC